MARNLPSAGEWARACASDGEFRLASRFWTGGITLKIGDRKLAIRIVNGEVSEGEAPDALEFVADAAVWEKLLAPVPRPYYQDLFGAQLAHGVRLPDDPLAYAAYYPALRRLMQLLSASREDAR